MSLESMRALQMRDTLVFPRGFSKMWEVIPFGREMHSYEGATGEMGMARDAHAVLSKIELRNFLCPVKAWIDVQKGVVEVRMAAAVRDRETGVPIEVRGYSADICRTAPGITWENSSYQIPYQRDFVEVACKEAVQTCLRDILNHELDEAWHFDGVRERDPHR